MAGFTVKIIKDLDHAKIQAFLDRAKSAARQVNVGFPDNGAKEADGTSVAMIAAVQNFGSPEQGIPERPFLTQAITKNQLNFIKLNRKNILKILEDKMTSEDALGQLGAYAAGQVQVEIKTGEFQELSPRTIARRKKNSTRPLYDTGQMVQSVTYVLVDK